MRPLYGHAQDVHDFVAELTNCPRGFGEYKAIGVIDDQGRLVGGMVYHNWSPEYGVIEMSGAATSKRWLTRKTLHALFAYPFDDCGCQLAVMRVSPDDKALARMLMAYGFRAHTIPRLRGRDKAEIIFTLADDDWRANKFMRSAHG